jgi:hypothetical protein
MTSLNGYVMMSVVSGNLVLGTKLYIALAFRKAVEATTKAALEDNLTEHNTNKQRLMKGSEIHTAVGGTRRTVGSEFASRSIWKYLV